MATKRLPIINWAANPRSGDVFPEPFSIKATNDVWKRLVMVFNDSGNRDGLDVGFWVPKDYVGSANLIVRHTSTAITNGWEADFDYRAVGGSDVESLDQTETQESVNGLCAAPSAALEKMEVSIALTDANFAVDDEVEGTFFRDGTDAGDAMAAAALLFSLFFEYSDA